MFQSYVVVLLLLHVLLCYCSFLYCCAPVNSSVAVLLLIPVLLYYCSFLCCWATVLSVLLCKVVTYIVGNDIRLIKAWSDWFNRRYETYLVGVNNGEQNVQKHKRVHDFGLNVKVPTKQTTVEYQTLPPHFSLHVSPLHPVQLLTNRKRLVLLFDRLHFFLSYYPRKYGLHFI